MIIRKLFKAEMAHSVPGAYTGRCHYLHGHSYKFELFLKSHRPNPANMVADFKAIKDMGINDFFDSFDHAVMVWQKDPVARLVPKVNPKRYLIVPFVPTAEMIAKACFVVCQMILDRCAPLSGERDVTIDQVLVHETDTGYAVCTAVDMKKDKFPDIAFKKWLVSNGIRSAWKNKAWFLKISGRAS